MASAGQYPIVQGAQTIKKFVDVAIEQPRPEGALNLTKWMRASGLRSSYFDDMPMALKFVGLVETNDQNGMSFASNIWSAVRDAQNGSEALLHALQQAYRPVLGHFGKEAVSTEDVERISSFIRTTENAASGDATAAALTMIRWFDIALGRAASDEPVPLRRKPSAAATKKAPVGTTRAAAPERGLQPPSATPGLPTAQIAVQVNIDPTATPDQIDAIFRSMAKHLYGKVSV